MAEINLLDRYPRSNRPVEERVSIIDGADSPKEVFENVKKRLDAFLKKRYKK